MSSWLTLSSPSRNANVPALNDSADDVVVIDADASPRARAPSPLLARAAPLVRRDPSPARPDDDVAHRARACAPRVVARDAPAFAPPRGHASGRALDARATWNRIARVAR